MSIVDNEGIQEYVDRIFQEKQDMVIKLFEEQKKTMEQMMKEKTRNLKKRIDELEKEMAQLKGETFTQKPLGNLKKQQNSLETEQTHSMGDGEGIPKEIFRKIMSSDCCKTTYNDWIYFIHTCSGRQLWKSRPDGSDTVCLDAREVSRITSIEDGYIFYTARNGTFFSNYYLKI